MSATAPVRDPAAASDERRVAATEFGAAFKRAMAVVRRLRGRDTHRRGDLSYAQYGLLFGLAEHGELTAGDLAAVADVTASTASKMLDRLVESGLVERVRSERDRRSVLVALTAHGGELVAARRAEYEERWARALSGFSREELLGATAVMERVIEMFDEIAAAAEAEAQRSTDPR